MRVSAFALCCASVFAQDTKTFHDLATKAAELAPISGSQPYHAVWNYTAYGFAKAKSAKGTLTVDYVDQHKWREVLTNELGYAEVSILLGNDLYVKRNTPSRLLRERQLLDNFEHFKSAASQKYEQKKKKVNGQPAECFQVPPSIAVGTYCFDPSTGLPLQLENSSGDTEFQSWRALGSRELPERWRVKLHSQVVVEAELAEATEQPATTAALWQPPVGASRETRLFCADDSVVGGRKIGGGAPVYPDAAKQQRIMGTVIMGAVIGTDGHVSDLTVLQTAGPLLDKSAADAVRTWTYEPYKQCGQPRKVDTMITVNYNLEVH